MEIRRIITGHIAEGKAGFIDDGAPPRSREFTAIPGMRASLVWATEGDVPLAFDGVDPTLSVTSFLPDPTGTRLLVMEFPPDAVYGDSTFDPATAAAENLEIVPGIAEHFEPSAPGMHTTPTIDYAFVLKGEPVLELDDGETTALKPGDIVIQNGTRHAWRNPTESSATIAFVMIGAHR